MKRRKLKLQELQATSVVAWVLVAVACIVTGICYRRVPFQVDAEAPPTGYEPGLLEYSSTVEDGLKALKVDPLHEGASVKLVTVYPNAISTRGEELRGAEERLDAPLYSTPRAFLGEGGVKHGRLPIPAYGYFVVMGLMSDASGLYLVLDECYVHTGLGSGSQAPLKGKVVLPWAPIFHSVQTVLSLYPGRSKGVVADAVPLSSPLQWRPALFSWGQVVQSGQWEALERAVADWLGGEVGIETSLDAMGSELGSTLETGRLELAGGWPGARFAIFAWSVEGLDMLGLQSFDQDGLYESRVPGGCDAVILPLGWAGSWCEPLLVRPSIVNGTLECRISYRDWNRDANSDDSEAAGKSYLHVVSRDGEPLHFNRFLWQVYGRRGGFSHRTAKPVGYGVIPIPEGMESRVADWAVGPFGYQTEEAVVLLGSDQGRWTDGLNRDHGLTILSTDLVRMEWNLQGTLRDGDQVRIVAENVDGSERTLIGYECNETFAPRKAIAFVPETLTSVAAIRIIHKFPS